MTKEQYSPEQEVVKLRQIDVLVGEGMSLHLACKDIPMARGFVYLTAVTTITVSIADV